MKSCVLTKMLGLIVTAAFVMVSTCCAEDSSQTLSPYFFIQGEDEAVDSFPLKSTDVTVRINGVIADVLVRQTYANCGGMPIHAKYVFPASTRAAVEGMTMTIGDRRIVAIIKEKEEAKKEFDQAKKSGKSASLLSQKRPNVFTMNVANIMPGDTVEIELHYTELLVPDKGIYEFVYPAVVGPRYSNQTKEGASEADTWIENPYLKKDAVDPTGFSITTHVSTGMPLYEVSCSTHKTNISFDSPSVAHITLKENETDGGNRDYILRYRLADKKIQSGLIFYAGKDENFFLFTVQPPKQFSVRDIPPREYIFVVDVSGSMNGFPLDVSKQVLENLIASLRPDDLFNVILFAGDSEQMAPVSLPATQDNIARAIRVISRQSGGGGTELYSAMKNALDIQRDESFSRSIIVVTDGYINGERKVCDLIQQNLADTNVFAFGIGSAVNRYLIEGMAHAGQGEPFIVTRPEESRPETIRFCDFVKAPLLKDIQIDIRGFDAYDMEPSVIPDMFSERPIVVVGKWRGPLEGSIAISGTGGQGLYQEVFQVDNNEPDPGNKAIRTLWARTRITRLSDFMFGRNEEAYREDITALGLKYNLLTKYTSFIAVSEVVRNPDGSARDVNQPLPLPKGVSELAVGQSPTSVPEPEMAFLVAILTIAWFLSRNNKLSSLLKR